MYIICFSEQACKASRHVILFGHKASSTKVIFTEPVMIACPQLNWSHIKTTCTFFLLSHKSTINVNFHKVIRWRRLATCLPFDLWLCFIHNTSKVHHHCRQSLMDDFIKYYKPFFSIFLIPSIPPCPNSSFTTLDRTSSCIFNTHCTTSWLDVLLRSNILIYYRSRACQHFLTILHFWKQCPPSWSFLRQTGHLVSTSLPLLSRDQFNGRLLCAKWWRICLIFGGWRSI